MYPADFTEVRKLPEIVDAGEFILPYVDVPQIPGGSLAPADDQLYRTVARPLLTDGRLPDPSRADEVLINRRAASDLDVGDRVTVRAPTDPDAFFSGAESPMRTQRATVVGIGDGPMDQLFGGNESPGFTPSWGFFVKYPEVQRVTNLVVRLKPGTDVDAFHRRVVEAMGIPNMPVRDLAQDNKRITNGTDLERTGLLLFAAAAFFAGLVLVGQALTRVVYAIAEARPALHAMGLTRGQLAMGLVAPFAVTAAAAAVVAASTRVAAVALVPDRVVGPARARSGLRRRLAGPRARCVGARRPHAPDCRRRSRPGDFYSATTRRA